jgi:o-succinylbenzoate synthase
MRLYYVAQNFFFNFPAYTSRGTLYERQCWFLVLTDESNIYIGECAPLAGLSRDPIEQIPQLLSEICEYFNTQQSFPTFCNTDFPSVAFAIESLQLQLQHQQNGLLFPSAFTEGKAGIAINGLIWAGTRDHVLSQIEEKIRLGFPCIKMKIGALPFDEELNILATVRKHYPQVEIRLDANGAFEADEALSKIDQLSQFVIHSIEQPIRPRQWHEMKRICEHSPVPIALDEELIPLTDEKEKIQLIDFVQPAYIILKPSLLGGFCQAKQWIQLAAEKHIGWWITSALESNVGLNAIAQWTYNVAPDKVHGLGTGKIYKNNIPSPLQLKGGKIYFCPEQPWDMSSLQINR